MKAAFTAANVLLFIAMYMIVPILYFMLRNEAKARKNIILGVTLPYRAREDEDLLGLVKWYKIWLSLTMLALSLAVIPALFIGYISVKTTYYLCWLLVAIVLPFWPYVRCHLKLKKMKAEKGWTLEAPGRSYIDIKVALMPKKTVSVWWFLPPFLISLLPVFFTLFKNGGEFKAVGPVLLMYVIDTLLIVLFYIIYQFINRQKSEMIDDNTALSVALTQVRRYHWSRCWLFSAWATGLFNLALWVYADNMFLMTIVACLYTVAILYIVLRAEFKTRKAQYEMTKESGKRFYIDDDEVWILGMFYYNPNDTRFMVNDRVGIGMSVNYARRGAQVLMAFAVLILLAMPLMGVWLIDEEFTPVSLSFDSRALVAVHTKPKYIIELDDIEQLALLEELPPTYRISGSSMDSLRKGTYEVGEYGSCLVLLDPNTAPFLYIKTADRQYILGSADAAQTQRMYDIVMNKEIE